MDLGISGRKAIVCASTRGLGRACAEALAQAGCEVVINGRRRELVDAAVEELRSKAGTKVTGVAADVSDPAGQQALLAACPDPDILVNNNSGPPLRDFRTLILEQMLEGVVAIAQGEGPRLIERKLGVYVHEREGGASRAEASASARG